MGLFVGFVGIVFRVVFDVYQGHNVSYVGMIIIWLQIKHVWIVLVWVIVLCVLVVLSVLHAKWAIIMMELVTV